MKTITRIFIVLGLLTLMSSMVLAESIYHQLQNHRLRGGDMPNKEASDYHKELRNTRGRGGTTYAEHNAAVLESSRMQRENVESQRQQEIASRMRYTRSRIYKGARVMTEGKVVADAETTLGTTPDQPAVSAGIVRTNEPSSSEIRACRDKLTQLMESGKRSVYVPNPFKKNIPLNWILDERNAAHKKVNSMLRSLIGISDSYKN